MSPSQKLAHSKANTAKTKLEFARKIIQEASVEVQPIEHMFDVYCDIAETLEKLRHAESTLISKIESHLLDLDAMTRRRMAEGA